MLLLLSGFLFAQEPDPCHFEQPVSITDLKDAMKECYLPTGTQITVQVIEVDPESPKSGIGFYSNDSALTSGGKQTLDGLASILAVRKSLTIKVVGYADGAEQGDLLDLSLRRAQVAQSYLISVGVDGSRIAVEAGGADNPVDSSGTSEGRARNRRVEFVMSAAKPVQ